MRGSWSAPLDGHQPTEPQEGEPGDRAITQGTLALTGNYVLTYVGANVSITQATLTVTADSKAKVFGDTDPPFTFQYSGFKYSDGAGVIDTPRSVVFQEAENRLHAQKAIMYLLMK
jgi:hypothetical protein